MSGATAEQEKKAQDRLAKWIDLEHKIVTYREVSREVGVNINTAKNMLVRYLKANPTTFPTYILTGTYLPTRSRSSTPVPTSDEKIETPSTPTPTSTPMDVDETTPKAVKGERDGPTIDPDEIKPEITKLKSRKDDPYPVHCEDVERKGMLLVGGKETLESKLELFVPSTIKVQIYSLSPSQISDPAQYLPPTLRLRQRENYNDPEVIGSVTGRFEMTTIEKPGESSKSAAKSVASKTKPTTSASVATKASAPKAIFGSKTKSREDSEKPEEPVKEKPAKTVRKKKVRSESPSETETEKPEMVKGKGKTTTMPVNKSAEPLQKVNDEQAEQMIMDSFWDDEAAGIPSSDAMVAEEDHVAGEDTSAKVSGKGMQGSRPTIPQKRSSTAVSQTDRETTPTPSGSKGGSSGRIRKKRRVVRSETKMNDKGYIVTEDVSGEESYSSDGGTPQPPKKAKKAAPKLTKSTSTTSLKSEPPAKPKTTGSSSAAASKPAAAAKPKKKGQQTLAGFFKKA
ncbi:hypothetical protein FFLO_02055 [Filobasidium floriforme]|uniref:DNA polymerase delta subunit 3 n=1 Tax=Filobasidium floriforme TaxID=5210 RepID=A0A8K0JNM3_9TREE|nr:DNA polymerase subunit Cdc27-domain-containing protein [Filobasidium floriforme]KAG7562476.1 hypothetical protein FFLO_02055 [Filobasidium floriforme]KAH8088360.1 DNA polymerase subunit Cdc27-domain-containing protein [Filobasidium floriforme]